MTALVLAEHDNKSFNAATLHAVTAASQVGGDIHILVAGSGSQPVAEQAAKVAGVAKVLHADDPAYEGRLAENRPDILGGLVAWHGDDGAFTQVVYFRSEDQARAGEAGGADERYQDMMAGEPTFIDLRDPHFD